jgi:pimeloyl-ACP methyl ester carboxylesterase
MAPHVRFVRGKGARIACAVDGVGPLLVLPAWWVSHVERDFTDSAFRRFFTRLAERFTVVRYDRPGVGLSDRERSSFTLEDEVENLLSVLDGLAVPRASLLAGSCGAPPALALAARQPDRVERLVLFGGYARGETIAPPEVRAALVGLVRASWGLGAKALSDIFVPEASAEDARRFAVEQRHSATAEVAARLLQLTFDMDVEDLVEEIRVPTLVLHRRQDGTVPFAHGRDLAARIPGARLVSIEGRSHVPWQGDPEPVLLALGEFLGQPLGATAPPPSSPSPAAAEFRREGEVWTVSFAGRTVHLRHARGLGDLAVLLAHPGRRFHAAELMEGPGDAAPARFGADPTLDERARLAFRERLARLDEELERAKAAGEERRAGGLEAERDALLDELRAATGLGGRRRTLGDAGERARKAVTARIRDSIARIQEVHPELGRHLDASVTTGTYCAYDGGAGAWST